MHLEMMSGKSKTAFHFIYWIALALTIVGGLNWLGICIAGDDGNVVEQAFGPLGARITYGIVGSAAVITLAMSIYHCIAAKKMKRAVSEVHHNLAHKLRTLHQRTKAAAAAAGTTNGM